MNDMTRGRTQRRIAIVGCGPKGLYALDSLCALVERAPPGCDIAVTVFDNQPALGAGSIYRLDQPDYLLMNYAACHIDAWDRELRPNRATYLTFSSWLEISGMAQPNQQYVARSRVGKYLNYCYQLVISSKPECLSVREVSRQVSQVPPVGDCWQLESSAGIEGVFDEVLIATGHQTLFGNDNDNSECAGPPRSTSVYPVKAKLNSMLVAPNSRVALKGFGLTWIDACLALTIGRGGNFRRCGERLVYKRSGDEPLMLAPMSRSGRPMLAKPDPDIARVWRGHDCWNAAEEYFDNLSNGTKPYCFERDILPAILVASDRLSESPAGASEDWLTCWMTTQMSVLEADAAIRTSLSVARGKQPCDIPAALGEAWRRLYHHLVVLVSHDGLKLESWPLFLKVSKEMERIAFGPPPENIERVISLIDAGVVDLRWVDFHAHAAPEDWPADFDVQVEAKIPAPSSFDHAGPLRSLEEQGLLQKNAAGCVTVSRSAQVMLEHGEVAGLSVVGRPTEGSVIGNDTLSRVLHLHPSKWAARVVARFAQEGVIL